MDNSKSKTHFPPQDKMNGFYQQKKSKGEETSWILEQARYLLALYNVCIYYHLFDFFGHCAFVLTSYWETTCLYPETQK